MLTDVVQMGLLIGGILRGGGSYNFISGVGAFISIAYVHIGHYQFGIQIHEMYVGSVHF